MPETKSEDLGDTSDEVALKLGLWQGRAEWEAITETWCATHFDSLDMTVLEDTTNRFHKQVRAGRGIFTSLNPIHAILPNGMRPLTAPVTGYAGTFAPCE